MFIKIDKTNYFVNSDKYSDKNFKSEKSIVDEITEDIILRMDKKYISIEEKEKLRKKIYNRYLESKNKNLQFY